MVLVLGVNNVGRDYPAVMRFADAMARSGVAVLVPDSAALLAGTLNPDETGGVVDAFRLLASRPEVDPQRVGLVGLSVGGTLAAWAAQERPDVDRAVLIAPMLGVAQAPGPWTPVVTRLMRALPNVFIWWDADRKQDLPGPKRVFPRFATRSVAATLRLGAVACHGERRDGPACRSLAIVTVGGDRAVDNDMIAALVRDWREHGARDVVTFEFPARLRLNHDVVDPEQIGGNPAITYPVLTRLIGP